MTYLKNLKSLPAYTAGTGDPNLDKKTPQGSSIASDFQDINLDRIVRGPKIYKRLKRYLLTEAELVQNRFPRSDKSKGAPVGKAVILPPEDKKLAIEVYSSTLVPLLFLLNYFVLTEI